MRVAPCHRGERRGLDVGSEEGRSVDGHALYLVGELNQHGATWTTRAGTEKEPVQRRKTSDLEQCVGRRYCSCNARSQEKTWSPQVKSWPVLVERRTERQAYRLGPHSGAAGIKPGRPSSEPASLGAGTGRVFRPGFPWKNVGSSFNGRILASDASDDRSNRSDPANQSGARTRLASI
jgi:hypothetical protein